MLRLFEMFAGYGGASHALNKAGIEFECVGYSEIDKFAIQCYEQNHKGRNYGDATKININELPDFDLLTGGFPCQSFSVAGKGLGELDTRGTLFNDIIRVAEVKKPKYMLLENVKGLTAKRHKDTFDKILSELDRIGYIVWWQVLNSKEHGIPQNRERVFFQCIRKDLNEGIRAFPEKEKLELFLKDILEENVDEKYYLSEEKTEKLLAEVKWENVIKDLNRLGNVNPSGKGQNGNVYFGEVSPTITTNKGEGIKMCLPCITPDRINKRQNGRRFKDDGEEMFTLNTQDRHGILQINNPSHSNDRVYGINGVATTLNTMQGGDRQPFILIKNATKKGYLIGFPGDGVNLEHPDSKTRRGRIQKDVIGCLQTNDQRGVITYDLGIRKLTPTECFRLMGFLDDNINLEGISNSQRYKLAGNGWDINLVSKIFKEMFSSEFTSCAKEEKN